MYKYRDYFSRSVLNKCGVSPDRALELPGGNALSAQSRQSEVQKAMAEIYSVFLHGAMQKFGQNAPALLDGLRLDERILSAFYDADVLKESDRRDFPEDYRIEKNSLSREQTAEERVSISVPESEDLHAESSQKVQESAPQRGKSLS